MVLDRAIDSKRRVHVVADIEELNGRDLVGKAAPVLAAVVRQHCATVVTVDQIVRVVGVDEQRVVVSVHASQSLERLAAIARYIQRQSHHVDGVLVVRVDANLPEDPAVGGGERTHVAIRLAYLAPRFAFIVGAIDFGTANATAPFATVRIALPASDGRLFVVVDEGVEHIWLGAAEIDSNPTAVSLPREALR